LSTDISSVETIFYLAPPRNEGLEETRVKHFINFLKRHSFAGRIIYISTSGVYGNLDGAWADESTPHNPETIRAKRRVSAESQFLDIASHTIQAIILRVPGIYGPGRLPINKIIQGNKILRESECRFTNLIHVNDLASVCIAAAKNGLSGQIYNVSDTKPVTSSLYYKLVAEVAGLQPPEELSFDEAVEIFDEKRLSFLKESRRLVVDKMLLELKPNLAFTDLRKGIQHALANSDFKGLT